jgi:hypothetical protein
MVASLGVISLKVDSRSKELIVGQSPASKNMNSEAEEATAFEAVTR